MEGQGTRLKLRGGIWYIISQGNTRGRSTRTGDRPTAERALATYIQERDRQDAVKNTGLTVGQALNDYLVEYARPTKIASLVQAELACQYLNLHFPTDKLVTDISGDDIDDPKPNGKGYVQKRRGCELVLKRKPKPAGNGTIRRELGTLVAAFGHAVTKKRISRMALPVITPPAAPNSKDRWLTIEEEKALIDACPVLPEGEDEKGRPRRLSRVYRFMILAADTAARKEALTSLTWFQVDFTGSGIIHLNPADRAQTKKRRPPVPMSRRLRAVLERAYREKESSYVLDHKGSIRTSFEGAVERARLEKVTPHTLRHTWATRAMRAGVPPIDVANMLGDDLKTVMKNYYHHHPDYLKGAADWRDREAASVDDQKQEAQ